MKPRRLWYIISIFLSGAFSARAQSPELRAVEYERVIFEGAAPAAANEALLGRAACLARLGRWEDASASLDRLRVYALDPVQREEAGYLKTLSYYRQGNYEAAYAVLGEYELSDAPDRLRLKALVLAAAQAPALKSPQKAMFLSIIPTAGHLYLERRDLWWTTAGTVASAAFSVYEAVSGNWLTAILGGALLINAFYIDSNLRPAAARAQEYNAKALEKMLSELENQLEF